MTRQPSPRLLLRAALLSLPLLAAGCAVLDPVDAKPEPAAPADWKNGRASADAKPAPDPWTAFGDHALDTVVARALANSPDLASAYARARAARASAGLADSGFWPTVSAGASAERARTSGNVGNPVMGGKTRDTYAAGGAIAYEVDLWGRVKNLSKAAEADYVAAHADLAAARNLVAAEVVTLWLNYRQSRAERLVLADELDARVAALDILAARESAGLISGDATARARLDVATAKVSLDAVALRVVLLRNALVAAVGESPGAEPLPEPDDARALAVPAVPLTLPSALLRNRPDLVAADRRMDAALAREGAARADFYPNLTLSATGGFSSVSSGDLFDKNSRTWTLGPSVNLPIFTGGRNDANLELARARFDADWANYRKTVLAAFRETEDALATLDRLATQEQLVALVNNAAADALNFAQARFDKGVSSNLEVSLARRDLALARRQAVIVRHDRLRAVMDLSRALGSGWSAEAGLAASAADLEKRLEDADRARTERKKS